MTVKKYQKVKVVTKWNHEGEETWTIVFLVVMIKLLLKGLKPHLDGSRCTPIFKVLKHAILSNVKIICAIIKMSFLEVDLFMYRQFICWYHALGIRTEAPKI